MNSNSEILEKLKKSIEKNENITRETIYYLTHCGESEILSNWIINCAMSKTCAQDPHQNKPRVSVVIPCYNYGKYIKDCVLSVLAQSFIAWEIIIVNDGSTDNTHEIVLGLLSQFPRHAISYINQEQHGIVQPRNRGVGMARGQYILPLDADDMIAPDFLEKTVRHLDDHPEHGYVSTKALFFGSVNKIWPREKFHPFNLYVTNQQTNTTLYRKQMWEDIGGYDERMIHGYMDWEFWINATKNGWIGYQIDEPLFFYRRKNDSVVMKAKKSDIDIKIQIMNLHPEIYITENIDKNNPELHRKNWIPPTLIRKKGFLPTKSVRTKPASPTAMPGGNFPKVQEQRILHVCHDFPPYKHAGAQLYALHLGKAQAAYGQKPSFFYPVASNPEQGLIRSSFEGLPVFETHIADGDDILASPQYALANEHVEHHFGTVLREQPISIVHFHLLYRLSTNLPLIARKAGIPSFATLHDYWLLCAMGHLVNTRGQECSGPESPDKCARCLMGFTGTPAPRLVEFFAQREKATRAAYGAIDHVIAPSHFLADIHARYGFPRPAVLPLGWIPVNPPAKRDNGQRPLVFGYCGQIIYRKGLDVALKAFRKVQATNWEFHIYGTVHDDAYFKALSHVFADDPRVRYMGPYTPDQLPEIYSSLDVSLIPSRRENYPLVLLETLSARIPPIVTDVGGVREMLVDGLEGFIIPAEDSSAMAKHIESFLARPSMASNMSRSIRPIKTISDNALEYIIFYDAALSAKTHGPHSPASPEFLSNIRLAEHYVHQGNPAKAEKYLEKAASIIPDDPQIAALRSRIKY